MVKIRHHNLVDAKAQLVTGIIILSIFITGFIGWVMNIVKLAGSNADQLGMLILRIIGIFIAPLGAVLGFFV